MILGESRVNNAYETLRNSQWAFHLTGSRFFGTHTDQSDWDFFIEWNDQIELWLEENEFALDSQSYANDPLFVKVYKRDNVHVQLVDNAKIKARIQHRLKPFFSAIKPDKEMAQRFWQLATRLYIDGQEGEKQGFKRVKIPVIHKYDD